jgi:hypothetical protein
MQEIEGKEPVEKMLQSSSFTAACASSKASVTWLRVMQSLRESSIGVAYPASII